MLPVGLTLDPCTGALTGTPVVVGKYQFSIVATDGTNTTTIGPIVITVGASPHELEITQFRMVGPTGVGDWLAQIYNTTNVTIPLTGWNLGVTMPSETTPLLIPLGGGTLAPGATMLVTGPFASGSATPDLVGPSSPTNPGGFELVAPDGTVTDRAGEVGADPSVIAGTGVTPPAGLDSVNGNEFVRLSSGGVPVDTDNNVADFTYTAGPTVSALSAVHAVHSGNRITVTWRTAPHLDAIGFAVYAGSHRVTTKLIPVHASRNYSVTLHTKRTGPVSVHALLRGGQELIVPAGVSASSLHRTHARE